MSPQASALEEKLIALVKGLPSKEAEPGRQIVLVKGVVTVGTDLLVELKVEQKVRESMAQ